jgi:hypothetical protein
MTAENVAWTATKRVARLGRAAEYVHVMSPIVHDLADSAERRARCALARGDRGRLWDRHSGRPVGLASAGPACGFSGCPMVLARRQPSSDTRGHIGRPPRETRPAVPAPSGVVVAGNRACARRAAVPSSHAPNAPGPVMRSADVGSRRFSRWATIHAQQSNSCFRSGKVAAASKLAPRLSDSHVHSIPFGWMQRCVHHSRPDGRVACPVR